MKKIVSISLMWVFITFSGVGVAIGQSSDELLQFSRFNFNMNTARSAAMGGAFTSLGADVSSMAINPAGLAMYSRSEVSVTPSLLINKNKVTSNTGASNDFSTTKFTLSNIAGVYSNGNFAIGASYNKVADFSGRYKVTNGYQNSSIGQVYADQLDGVPYQEVRIPPKGDQYAPYFNFPPFMWGAIMGYQGGLINETAEGNRYTMGTVFDYQHGDVVTPSIDVVNEGAMSEFNISGAYNYNNILFFGLTLGIPQLNFTQHYVYDEYANVKNVGNLDSFSQKQNLQITGTGFNVKVGVTVRPVDWLRIGVSYHSPNWMTVYERSYNDFTLYKFNVNGHWFADAPYLDNDYTTASPSRLLAGLSFSLGRRVIISADYELTMYSGMRYTSNINTIGWRSPKQYNIIDNYPNFVDHVDYNGNMDLNKMVSNNYRDTHNFRFGVEAQPVDGFFIRAGYAFNQSPYRTDILTGNLQGMTKDFGVNSAKELDKYGQSYQISGGLGYRSRGFGFDVTYVYGNYGQLPSKSYYYNSSYGSTLQSQGVVKTSRELHQIMATLLFKF